ncbi:putative nuclease HARBI1 [Quercus lobata]|uniref:putative nuclease HARBI1 n=1 Tax=Quercus lobata TaxID=97700 RepID=UPI001247C389|nr:putative nuclease HARBI1 [Quercus lobata]
MGRSLFKKLLFDDSDEDEIMRQILKGSTKQRKRRWYIERDRLAGHKRLYLDYFSDTPVYPPNLFRRRFRMSRNLFLRIQHEVEAYESYFIQKRHNAQKWGLSSLQKITAALRMLAYGVTADFMDEYVRIGESTAMKSLKKFVKAVVDIFSKEYLRSPNNEDIARLLANGERRGFPGMLGSIDCMHWKWKNCPVAWKGQYSGHIREPTIVLEAVASFDLWIWHAFFGLPGSNNDINVLERPPIFSELEQGRAPAVNYSINGHEYTMGYYLADGIYPKWSTFVKTIPSPRGHKHKLFAKAQEANRKDVERAFGVLQARFAIVRGPARFFHSETLQDIMKACVILHNMIVEDEQDINEAVELDYEQVNDNPTIQLSRENTNTFTEFIETHQCIRDHKNHFQLQSDLIEHLWQLQGEL